VDLFVHASSKEEPETHYSSFLLVGEWYVIASFPISRLREGANRSPLLAGAALIQ